MRCAAAQHPDAGAHRRRRLDARCCIAFISRPRQDVALDLPGIDVRFIPVGKSGDNVGIDAFTVRRYRANKTAYEVLVEVQNFRRARRRSVRLELAAGRRGGRGRDAVARRRRARAASLSQPRRRGQRGSRRASADAHDAFPLDDVAYALLPARHKQKVLLVTAGNLFLEGALLLDENLDVDKVRRRATTPPTTANYDAVVFDDFTPRGAPPRTHALYIDPQGEQPARSPSAARSTGRWSPSRRRQHPLMRWVTLKDLNIARASRFVLGAGRRGAGARRCASRSSWRAIATGTRRWRSASTCVRVDLPLRVAFPVLLVNALDWFAGDDGGLTASFCAGASLAPAAPPGASRADRARRPTAAVHARAGARRPRQLLRRARRLLRRDSRRARRPGRRQPGHRTRVAHRAADRSSTLDGQTAAPRPTGRSGLRRALWASWRWRRCSSSARVVDLQPAGHGVSALASCCSPRRRCGRSWRCCRWSSLVPAPRRWSILSRAQQRAVGDAALAARARCWPSALARPSTVGERARSPRCSSSTSPTRSPTSSSTAARQLRRRRPRGAPRRRRAAAGHLRRAPAARRAAARRHAAAGATGASRADRAARRHRPRQSALQLALRPVPAGHAAARGPRLRRQRDRRRPGRRGASRARAAACTSTTRRFAARARRRGAGALAHAARATSRSARPSRSPPRFTLAPRRRRRVTLYRDEFINPLDGARRPSTLPPARNIVKLKSRGDATRASPPTRLVARAAS